MANIIESLLSEVLSEKTLGNVAESVGVSSEQVGEVISAAIPTLIGAMSKNASTKEGAESLDKALEEHASKKKLDVAEEVKNADVKDGEGILKHVLGSDLSSTVSTLAKSVKIDKDQVMKIVAMVAPILLTFLASGKKSSKKESTDLSGLLGTFVTSAVSGLGKGNSSAGDIAGELVGGILKTLIK